MAVAGLRGQLAVATAAAPAAAGSKPLGCGEQQQQQPGKQPDADEEAGANDATEGRIARAATSSQSGGGFGAAAPGTTALVQGKLR